MPPVNSLGKGGIQEINVSYLNPAYSLISKKITIEMPF